MYGVVVAGNTIDAVGARGIDTYSTNGMVISGNRVKGVDGFSSINIRDARGAVISGNNAEQPSASTTSVCNVTASSSAATTYSEICGNRFGSEAGTISGAGVNLDNNVTYTGVSGNNVRATGGVSLGTGTGNAQANNIT